MGRTHVCVPWMQVMCRCIIHELSVAHVHVDALAIHDTLYYPKVPVQKHYRPFTVKVYAYMLCCVVVLHNAHFH